MDEIQSIGLVAWKYQADGGLGTGAMKHGNFTLLAKWGWRYMAEPRSLYQLMIRSIHGHSSFDRQTPSTE